VLSPQDSRSILHSRHPADCILPILVRKMAVGIFPATAISNCLLRFRVSSINQRTDIWEVFEGSRIHQHMDIQVSQGSESPEYAKHKSMGCSCPRRGQFFGGVISGFERNTQVCGWNFFVTRIFPQHKPSCILSQHEVHCPCTVERLVDASPFFLLLDTSFFKTFLTCPCTML